MHKGIGFENNCRISKEIKTSYYAPRTCNPYSIFNTWSLQQVCYIFPHLKDLIIKSGVIFSKFKAPQLSEQPGEICDIVVFHNPNTQFK